MQLSTQLNGRQLRLYQFIRSYQAREGRPPTYAEMQTALGFSTKSLVRYHLNALVEQGYLDRAPSVARGVRPPAAGQGGSFPVPILGYLDAGRPVVTRTVDASLDSGLIEALELTRAIIPEEDGLFALRVRGDAMLDVLLRDGDIVVMKPSRLARDGQLVAVNLRDGNSGYFLRRWQRDGERVCLKPDDPRFAPIWARPEEVAVQGLVIAVIRET